MTGRFLGLVVLLSFAGQRFSEAQTTLISNFSLHDSRGAKDKEMHMIAGDHYLLKPADARPKVADLIAQWLGVRC